MESVIALLVIAGAGGGWAWRELWRRRRQPTPGHLVIAGVVVATGPPLSAPLSGTPCVYWQLAFLEVGVGDWVERARIDAPGEFLVEHPGGVARVVAEHARLSAPPLEEKSLAVEVNHTSRRFSWISGNRSKVPPTGIEPVFAA